MDWGRVASIAAPILLLVGTTAFILYMRVPKLSAEKTVLIKNKRLRLLVGDAGLATSTVLILENDTHLSCKTPVAKQVLQFAGASLTRECEDWVKKFGLLEPGEIATTKGGLLPCKHVIHVVPTQEPDLSFLGQLFKNVLRSAAESLNATSITITLVGLSSGYDLSQYSQILVTECKGVLEAKAEFRLEEVLILCPNTKTLQALIGVLE